MRRNPGSLPSQCLKASPWWSRPTNRTVSAGTGMRSAAALGDRPQAFENLHTSAAVAGPGGAAEGSCPGRRRWSSLPTLSVGTAMRSAAALDEGLPEAFEDLHTSAGIGWPSRAAEGRCPGRRSGSPLLTAGPGSRSGRPSVLQPKLSVLEACKPETGDTDSSSLAAARVSGLGCRAAAVELRLPPPEACERERCAACSSSAAAPAPVPDVRYQEG
mmetsp:Transcript_106251/g.317475  ORF Transcript_106251/g.317475 Transcript_106251/m.317475 type:complete len:216 (+) Transcript_106251:744-1391(+)